MSHKLCLAERLVRAEGDFEKTRIVINGILPESIGDWWCITMDKKEVIKFKGHKMQLLSPNEQVVVPFFKGLSKNYRQAFPENEIQLGKVTIC